MPPGSPRGNSVSRSSTAYPLGAKSDMVSGLWHQSQPFHLLPFLQHTGSIVSPKALLHSPGSSPPVMMRSQAVYNPTTEHPNVWRWLWQFLMWHAEDTSAHPFCQDEVWRQASISLNVQPFWDKLLPQSSAIVKIIITGRISFITRDYTYSLHCSLVFRTGQFKWLIIQCRRVD